MCDYRFIIDFLKNVRKIWMKAESLKWRENICTIVMFLGIGIIEERKI